MGFFFSEALPDKAPKKGEILPLELLHEQKCKVCPQKRRWPMLQHPKMSATGSTAPLIYWLGEAPGENEDIKGEQFIGDSGTFLRDFIPEEYKDQGRWNNTIRCRPPDNRTPLPVEIECCRKFQERDIEKTKPLVVVAIGGTALKWAIPGATAITSWRGWFVPAKIGEHVCWVYPILHPSGVLRTMGGDFPSETEIIFERDLEKLFTALDDGLSSPKLVTPDPSDVECLLRKGNEDACSYVEFKLAGYAKEPLTALDWETQGLRPYKDNAKLLTAAIHSEFFGTFSFPVEYPGYWQRESYKRRVKEALVRYIESKGTKVCHNTKFEQEWSLINLDADIGNVPWEDTEAMAYILENRKGMLDLDTQTRVHLGFWVKDLTKANLDKNNMEKMPLEILLPYGAYDVRWLLLLRNRLLDKIENQGKEKAKILHDVLRSRVKTGTTLAYVQAKGMPASKRTALKLKEQFQADEEKEYEKAHSLRGFKEFKKMTGRFPNIDSHPDMVKLFGNILQVPECRTAAGGITTRDEILSSIKGCPEAAAISRIRKIQKVIGSFLSPLIKSHIYEDGLVHCSFNHLFVDTSRLSSDDPNMQNQPKRRFKQVRGIFEARKGYKIVSIDYGAIEARCIAMASAAEFLVNALWEDYDVHAEWARKAYEREPKAFKYFMKNLDEVPDFKNKDQFKKYRDIKKNKFVFPLFFGSSKKSVGPACHLTESAADDLVGEFWDTFGEVKDWHRATANFYSENGYVETLFGFRRYGPIGYNEQINAPIQGTAGEMPLRAGNRLRIKHNKIYNLNVHDDLTFVVKEKFLKKNIDLIAREMVYWKYPFVNVPIIVEVQVGQNWNEQEFFGKFSSVDFGHKRGD